MNTYSKFFGAPEPNLKTKGLGGGYVCASAPCVCGGALCNFSLKQLSRPDLLFLVILT